VAMGEPEATIHVIGSPELDFHSGPSGVTLDDVRARYDLPQGQFGIVVFHPVTSEAATMGQQARDLFDALNASGKNFVVIAPNNDPGSNDIFAVLDGLPKDRFRILPSMRFAHFSELMKTAACMIGNSSAGVREAPFLGTPSLDVGTRQTNRAQAPSLHSVEASDQSGIAAFLDTEWGKRYERHDAFGQGDAAARFGDMMDDPAFWDSDLQKRFHDQ